MQEAILVSHSGDMGTSQCICVTQPKQGLRGCIGATYHPQLSISSFRFISCVKTLDGPNLTSVEVEGASG